MGGSSRPHKSKSPFRSPCNSSYINSSHGEVMTPAKAADFFIDSLEEFRLKEQITNFVLAGHSLGGYLSARYAIKYGSCEQLLLISPVGIAPHPNIQSKISIDDLSFGMRAFASAWKWNFTPQQLIRSLGPKGLQLVQNTLLRRFNKSRWNSDELQLIANYLYHITVASGSGEYALNSLLEPIASTSGVSVYAREPLAEALASIRTPTLLLYGDRDWLHPKDLSNYYSLWKSNNSPIDISIIPRSGHHLYLDNSVDFHESIRAWMQKG